MTCHSWQLPKHKTRQLSSTSFVFNYWYTIPKGIWAKTLRQDGGWGTICSGLINLLQNPIIPASHYAPLCHVNDKRVTIFLTEWCIVGTRFDDLLDFYHGTIGVNQTNLLNSLRPNDAIWWQISGSTLAQVRPYCLTAPSHYLNQCCFSISKVHGHSFLYTFTRATSATNH